ncbi:MAG: RNA polymerase sigma factor, partial [Bacteroidota bacterium]
LRLRLYNLNRNAAVSEDLVQNVFVRILKYRHRFRGDGEFKSWMFFIARNINIDHFKRNKFRYADAIDDWKDRIADDFRSDETLMKQEELERLHMALDYLDPDKKEVLVMSKLDGMPYKQIGEVLGCTEGAVKVKVFRALKALKAIYTQMQD